MIGMIGQKKTKRGRNHLQAVKLTIDRLLKKCGINVENLYRTFYLIRLVFIFCHSHRIS